ncbi:MAG: glycosyltransferase family 2 protein [Opitutaceae bacterium]
MTAEARGTRPPERGSVPEYSVVIPAYNEERRLPPALRELTDYGNARGTDFEVIAVVERSRDRTLQRAVEVAARRPPVRVIDNPIHRGKGYAVRTGVHRARGGIIFVMDADLSVPVNHVGYFLDRFAEDPGIDLLVGNRQHPDSLITRRQSRVREMMGKSFNRIVRIFGYSRMLDTQCGFKAYRSNAARAIFERQMLDGFVCDLEAIMLAETMGFRVVEMPVRWVNSPESRVRLFVDSLHMLLDLLRLRRLVRQTLRDHPYPDGTAGTPLPGSPAEADAERVRE